MYKMTGYHTTGIVNQSSINSNGFAIDLENKVRQFTSDLGQGLYAFCKIEEEHYYFESPDLLSKKFAEKFRSKHRPYITYELDVHVDDDKYLDLDEPASKEVITKVRMVNSELIQENFDLLNGEGAKKRGSLDGIVIELFLKQNDIQVDVIKKETFTPIDNLKEYKKSSFPNGIEICVRSNDVIKKYSEV